MAISYYLAHLVREQERRITEVQFQHDAQQRIESIQRAAIDRLSVIYVLSAFYAGSEFVERAEFQTFTAPLLERFQGVQVLGWAPIIAEGERSAHEESIRKNGLADYRIVERDDIGRYIPSAERAEYCPILYVEPFEKYRAMLGFDLCSDPACRSAMKRAKADGRQAAAVCSPMGKDATTGRQFYVFSPIRGFKESAVASDDRPRTVGFVFGIFDVDLIVEEALQSFPPAGIDIAIREHVEKGEGQPLYIRSSFHLSGNGARKPAFDSATRSSFYRPVTSLIKAVDRWGEIVCVPTELYVARYRTSLPDVVLLTGLLITALLMGLLFLLTGRTARVRRLIAQRTAELRASEQRFRRLVENAGDAVFLHDLNGRVVDVNRRACESLGYTRDELLALKISEIDAHFFAGNLSNYWGLPDHEYPVTFSGVHLRKDGSVFPVEIRMVSIYAGNERLMLGFARDVTERRLAEEKLRKEQRLLRDMLDLHERDRKLVAYEIHDGLAQQLTAALMKFQSIGQLLHRDPSAAENIFDEASLLLREAMAETRRLIGGLRPPVLDESGIIAAVEVLIYSLQKAGAPKIEFAPDFTPQRFAPPVESAAFRIVQESLTNACRYSRSDKIRVELGLFDDRLTVDVRDWGAGFDPEKVDHGHFGVRGIRERARLLGGSAAVESAPGQGTRIHVELPLLPPVENGNGSK